MIRPAIEESDQFLFDAFDALLNDLRVALDQGDEELFLESKDMLLKTAALIDKRLLR